MTNELSKSNRTLLLVGSMGPLGHCPASGTVAVAVAGIPLVWALSFVSSEMYILITVVVSLFSVWIHHVGDRVLGEKDSRKLVWDEIVGFLIAMAFVKLTWQLVTIGFFMERAIDIAKIPPANLVEDKVPGGWGVVGDDVIAGLYTCLILHMLMRFAPTWMGIPIAS